MMAVEGIGNLVQLLAEQLREQTPNLQAGTNTPGTENANTVAVTEDTFTPSGQGNPAQASAQDAGIFQVSQGALAGITAGILFAQTNSNANQTLPSEQQDSGSAANAGNSQQPGASAVKTPVVPGQIFPPPAGQGSAAKATPTPNEQEQIQFLNAALPALGLSKVEITEIDNIATQIQNFNPAAYTNLVNQFEALVQQSGQQGAANPAANTSTPGGQGAPTNTKANGGGSQG
jgi:hypothetical protein